MRRLLALTAILALVTAACRFETNFEAQINADGTGLFIAEIGVDDEARELLEGFSEGGDIFEGNDLGNVPGATQREETRGDMTFFIIEVPATDVTQLEEGAIAADNTLFENLDISVTDTLVSVNATVGSEGALEGADELVTPEILKDSFSASVRLRLPGKILEHNADRKSGNLLTWEVPLDGTELVVTASSDPTGTPESDGGGGFPVWLIIVLVVAAGGGIAYFASKRKKETALTEALAEAAEAADTPPPPPPPAE